MATATMTRPTPRVVGGVCSGFAAHTGLPVGAVRLATAVLVVCGGAGLLLYAWLWATVPSAAAGPAAGSAARGSVLTPAADVDEDPVSARRTPVVEILLGVALLAAAGAVVAARMGVAVPLEVIVPGVVVVTGAALAWRQFDALRDVRSAASSTLVVRALGALVLVVLGILLFFTTSTRPNVWTVLTAAVAVLVGVAVVVAPWVVRLVRDLAEERAARVRDLERAEFAAHLHDSVLQTLALIQQKAEPGSDAARLARAQERELRSWLFTEQAEPARDLGTQLRDAAVDIEAEYPARIEVIAVGPARSDLPDGLVSAAREAMLNAARHAGGTVSVYAETARDRAEISIRDRGPGFDVDTVPVGRYGVRESIVGRMQRLGGHATIAPGPGRTGTEVRLTLPLASASHDEEHA
ncbi:ATP-binding protein [Curtobacterium aurantiacum]|uniref:PspC domain-containing protein n=1 Tax=Curtobacterium aurantiacum TaxID=3236919 RepID=A0ABS5VKY2_9MICO|nr:ATP-binding protein [Curtobacterium flaccumfaciens]MBT1546672.1 PspC domain-containing protein [Curtobacterium flaccumfaciens pv. flaccumfaciens]MBT1589536.1 PspC domain-containing protein [Curtobacterium flaccumfaciens pv. flaccumfaciens]MBT1681352.1 PspC domain-containing protein [Curtobacterium flaccumfaciens pv. flaccumfaciens]